MRMVYKMNNAFVILRLLLCIKDAHYRTKRIFINNIIINNKLVILNQLFTRSAISFSDFDQLCGTISPCFFRLPS